MNYIFNRNVLLAVILLSTPIFSQFSTLNADDIDRSVNRPLGGGAGLHRSNPANVDYSRGGWQGGYGGYHHRQPTVYNYYNYPYDYGYYDNISPYPYYDYNYYDYNARYPALSYPLSTYIDNTSLYNPSTRYTQPPPAQTYYYNPNQ